MRDRQIKAFELVREEDRFIKARHAAANKHLKEIRSRCPKYSAGEWVWVYNDHSTIAGGGGQHVSKNERSRLET